MRYFSLLIVFFSFSLGAKECLRCCSRECGPFIVLAVEARRLDYKNAASLIRTIAKHPSDGSKNSDVGHAWIYMQRGDEIICGGHSAERGELQPRYLEGVCLLAEKGDPNPARYLFQPQRDGYFEEGSGGHFPTFALKIPITSDDYDRITDLLKQYPWHDYALSGRSCATLVAEVAAVLGLNLEHKQRIYLEPVISAGKERLLLWEDELYSEITISSPDVLQESLKKLAQEGRGWVCTKWIRQKQPESFRVRLKKTCNELRRLPSRTLRYFSL